MAVGFASIGFVNGIGECRRLLPDPGRLSIGNKQRDQEGLSQLIAEVPSRYVRVSFELMPSFKRFDDLIFLGSTNSCVF